MPMDAMDIEALKTEGPKTEGSSALGTCAKVGGGCCGCCCIYLLLLFVPILLFPTSDLMPNICCDPATLRTSDICIPECRGDYVPIPNAATIVDNAIKVLHNRTLEMTVSLLDPHGAYVARRMTADASTMTFGAAYYKFNFLKANNWDTDKVCDAGDSSCIMRSMLMTAFTHKFSCPGAVVLRNEGKVVGVLALSGGQAIQDHDVASAAVEAAGYTQSRTVETDSSYSYRDYKRAYFDFAGAGNARAKIFEF